MTTYPLSEAATMYDDASDDAAVCGTLAECAEILQRSTAQERASKRIEMDDVDVKFGPDEIEDLLLYLREESAGLSNQEISAIKNPDS